MPPFDLENPDLNAVKAFLQRLLVRYKLDESYEPNDILVKVIMRGEEQSSPGTIDEIQVAFLKTAGLEIIQDLDRERRTANKQKFVMAVQSLFEDNNPDARSFCAGIARKLYQFRLRITYEEREIITEAYILGIKQIESGTLIEKPLAWLRKTCFNIIRDLRRKQDKEQRPKLDPTLGEPGDTVFSELMFQEDLQTIRLAVKKLTPEEQQLLHNRVCEEMAWQQVSESISVSGESSVSCGTARQRGSRALNKLRQHYDSIRDTVKMIDGDSALLDVRSNSETVEEDSSNGGNQISPKV